MKITGSTTLAELSAYLTTLGNPFITLIKSHPDAPHSRHVIAYVAGVGSFDGDGDTEAEALEAAFAKLRAAIGVTDPSYDPNAKLNAKLRNAKLREQEGEDGPRCEEKGQCQDLDGSGTCKGCGRWLGDETKLPDDLRRLFGSTEPLQSRVGISLAEQTERIMSGLTPREREILAMRLETGQRMKQDPAYNKFRQTSDRVPMRGTCHGCGHLFSEHPNESGCQAWHDKP